MIESAVMRVRPTTEICDVVNFDRRRQEVAVIHNCDDETANLCGSASLPLGEAVGRSGAEIGVRPS
jgi:hypothetical protein